MRANSLRARTMSVTPVMTLSRSGNGTRIERQAWSSAARSSSRRSWTSAGSGAGGCSAANARASITSASSPAGSPPPAPSALQSWVSRSITPSTPVTRVASAGRFPRRTWSSASSAACARAVTRGSDRKPELPLIVWTRRKIASSRSRSPGSASHATSAPPASARISAVSARKSFSRSSIAVPVRPKNRSATMPDNG